MYGTRQLFSLNRVYRRSTLLMKRKAVLFVIIIGTGLLILFSIIKIYINYQEEKEDQEYEREKARLEEQIQNSYNELIEFASANVEEIVNVSKIIVNKKADYPENESFDYKKIMQGESEDVIQDFECIFNKVNLRNFSSHYISDYMEYIYAHIDGTQICIIYYGNNSKIKDSGIETFNEYGDVTKITENIYVVYYAFPYV